MTIKIEPVQRVTDYTITVDEETLIFIGALADFPAWHEQSSELESKLDNLYTTIAATLGHSKTRSAAEVFKSPNASFSEDEV